MCGIVGAVAQENVVPLLLEGLRRLEYRGYDSCGIAVIHNNILARSRSIARVTDLAAQIAKNCFDSSIGIAHTRWATHGAPAVYNAHPHFSRQHIALVHNGIIENHDHLRDELQAAGYVFESQTDTEVIAHLIDHLMTACSSGKSDLFVCVQQAVKRLQGAYAIVVLHHHEPRRLIAACSHSPLIVGYSNHVRRYFVASDAMAIADCADQMMYLEQGDVVDICLDGITLVDAQGQHLSASDRPIKPLPAFSMAVGLGPYQHYMQKEIFEQPRAITDTLESVQHITPDFFGEQANDIFHGCDAILILACGSSYYAGLTAKYWLESLARIRTEVEIASEYRYRDSVPSHHTLVVAISQSGETADTLAALRHARAQGMQYTLTICNVAASTMVRESQMAYITRAGIEIGVASTKAFTTQLVALFLLTLALAKCRGFLNEANEVQYLEALWHLPMALQKVLALEPAIIVWSAHFARKENVLFLGRGLHYPIALEGALKLKEITYLHAEAYPAGELKHGPLALVSQDMPVVTVAPNDALIEKLKSNMQEVRARGGQLYIFADADSCFRLNEGVHVIHLPENNNLLSPILHVVPLQLLAYHTALARGTDVDKPRNLAKSVTVE